MRTHLTKKAGDFRAVCKQGAWLPAHRLEPGTDLDALASRWDRKLKENVYIAECALDTADRAEYLAHMADVHGKKPRGPAQLKRGRGMWPAVPRKADEKPFNTKADVETCDGCGLVAEHDGSNATELWWTEHQRGCAPAAAGGAA